MIRSLILITISTATLLGGQTATTKQAASAKTYATPEEARDALVQAAANGIDAVRTLLGPGSDDVVRTGDPVEDKNVVDRFNARAKEKTELVRDEENPDRTTLEVGNEGWPMPVPLLRKNGRWHWDLAAGKTEIRNRIIGGNELDAIEICLGYVTAQRQYAEVDRTGKGLPPQYATKLISSPGQKDGLYWPGEDSPVSEGFAKASAAGYNLQQGKGQAFHGYHFKVLTGQGASAYGGAHDYIVGGLMIGGFGLVAWPAEYRVSGVKTFIVNQDGVVYEKDLEPQTAAIAGAMTRFNPDKTWDESPDPDDQ
jgi:hypothetical protein